MPYTDTWYDTMHNTSNVTMPYNAMLFNLPKQPHLPLSNQTRYKAMQRDTMRIIKYNTTQHHTTPYNTIYYDSKQYAKRYNTSKAI